MPLGFAALETLSATHGESFFVLDGARFAQNFQALHKAFAEPYGPVKIGYSYKTNYTPQLCRIVDDLGGFAEVVSEMEYAHAKRLGVGGERIIFNGPVKAEWAFAEAALSGATLNLDSLRDVALLRAVAGDNPEAEIAVVVRVNFDIGGDVSRFGMDVDGPEFAETLAVIAAQPNLSLKGLHCHFPDRDLESFTRRAQGMVALTRQVFPDAPPEVLNIGGGYFSYMPESLRARFDVPPRYVCGLWGCRGRGPVQSLCRGAKADPISRARHGGGGRHAGFLHAYRLNQRGARPPLCHSGRLGL